jgi:hypothetical protein
MQNTKHDYNFKDQLEQGKRAEGFLDHYFSRWYHIQPVALDVELRDGYDRLYRRKSDGEARKVEYKSDWLAADTGNAFIETISVYEQRKPGWIYTSQADILIYYIPPKGEIHMLALPMLRMIFPSWKLRYKEVPAPNEGYKTYGVLVPMGQFTRFALTHRVGQRD